MVRLSKNPGTYITPDGINLVPFSGFLKQGQSLLGQSINLGYSLFNHIAFLPTSDRAPFKRRKLRWPSHRKRPFFTLADIFARLKRISSPEPVSEAIQIIGELLLIAIVCSLFAYFHVPRLDQDLLVNQTPQRSRPTVWPSPSPSIAWVFALLYVYFIIGQIIFLS